MMDTYSGVPSKKNFSPVPNSDKDGKMEELDKELSKIFKEEREEPPKQKTEETVLAAKLNKLCEQPLKKSAVYSSA